MTWLRRPDDREDAAQERALALLEGRDPDAAVRAWRAAERRWRDNVTGLRPDDSDTAARLARAPMPVRPRPRRSPGSVERRREYSRRWWRENGAAWRAARRARP